MGAIGVDYGDVKTSSRVRHVTFSARAMNYEIDPYLQGFMLRTDFGVLDAPTLWFTPILPSPWE